MIDICLYRTNQGNRVVVTRGKAFRDFYNVTDASANRLSLYVNRRVNLRQWHARPFLSRGCVGWVAQPVEEES